MSFQHTAARRRLRGPSILCSFLHSFNTQPPEGGCAKIYGVLHSLQLFQHTAARRRLLERCTSFLADSLFQHTAARRRLPVEPGCLDMSVLFQHTAARRRLREHQQNRQMVDRVSTHSRPKAAAHISYLYTFVITTFQHTAARRRLQFRLYFLLKFYYVSTHSRPKAAARTGR